MCFISVHLLVGPTTQNPLYMFNNLTYVEICILIDLQLMALNNFRDAFCAAGDVKDATSEQAKKEGKTKQKQKKGKQTKTKGMTERTFESK